jgi:TIR domain
MIEVHFEVLDGVPHWTIPPFDENEDVVKLSFGTAGFAQVSERDAFEIIKDAVRRVQYEWVQPSLGTWKLDLSALADFMVRQQRPDLAWLRGTIAAKPEFRHENLFSGGTRIGTAEFIFYITADAIAEAASGEQSGSIAERNLVFISYSHADEKWLRRLLLHLRPLERKNLIELFDDTKIKAGANWRQEIADGLEKAKVAGLLVSADFIASDFIAENELPPLLKKAKEGGATIIPVIVGPSRFTREEGLSAFQAINDPKRPLCDMSAGGSDRILVEVSYAIEDALKLTNISASPRTTVGLGCKGEPVGTHAKELLKLIRQEKDPGNMGITKLSNPPESGYVFFVATLRSHGEATVLKMKSSHFREGIDELLTLDWLNPPEHGNNVLLYEFRG